jgi:hypothetical protein
LALGSVECAEGEHHVHHAKSLQESVGGPRCVQIKRGCFTLLASTFNQVVPADNDIRCAAGQTPYEFVRQQVWQS